MARQRCESIGPAPEHFRCGLDKGHDGAHSALSETGALWFAVPWRNRDGSEPEPEPVTRLLYSETSIFQHPGTIDNPEPVPVLTFADIKAAVAKLEKAAIKPFEGRCGFIPGHCKDCKHWSKNGSTWLALESDCGALVAASEAVDVPEDGSGFCWLFEAKP